MRTGGHIRLAQLPTKRFRRTKHEQVIDHRRLATAGPYARLRHPQYVGFVLIMFGFLVQWPTLVTLAMFTILVTMYALLARREEAESEAAFGDAWRAYAARTPRFIPRVTRWASADRGAGSA